MANANTSLGLRPVKYLTGQPYTGGGIKFYANDTSTAITAGMPVTLTGSGDADGVPGVKVITVDDTDTGNNSPILGVVTGILGQSDGSLNRDDTNYIAGGSTGYVLVETDPNVLYEVESDGTFSAADIGAYGNLEIGSLSTITGFTTVELDQSTLVTADAGNVELDETNVRVWGLVDRVDNTLGANAKVYVQINYSQVRGAGAAAATAV